MSGENLQHQLNEPSQWLDLHGDALFRFAIMRVSDQIAAEDLVQDTFVAALKAKERFAGKSSERTWLTGILKHKILDYYRKSGREISESTLSKEEDFSLDVLFRENGSWKIPPRDWESTPEKSVINAQLGEFIQFCIEQLPDVHRKLFIMREIDDLSTEEICKELDLSQTNLWVTMHRCRARLRKCIETSWFKGTERYS